MSVPFALHCLQVERRVPLVRGAQLMMPDCFVVGNFRPLRRADMVLRVNEGVADEADVGHYADEFFGRHRGPDVPVYLGVVDLDGLSVSLVDAVGKLMSTRVGANQEGWSEYGS